MALILKHTYLLNALEYNPETGIFLWKWRDDQRTCVNSKMAFREAGTVAYINGSTYKAIVINQKQYMAHRLAWFYVYGESPQYIDHKDGNGLNNIISNLRVASASQNRANSCELKRGVSWHKVNQRWQASIGLNYKVYYLGQFDTIEEAYGAYDAAAIKYFGEFARCMREIHA